MRSLFAKIMLAQVVAVILALLVVMALTRLSLHRGFLDFLERQESGVLSHLGPVLAEVYVAQGGWNFLRDQPDNWHRILRRTRHLDAKPPPPEGRGRFPARIHPPPLVEERLRWLGTFDRLGLRQRLFLLDEDRRPLAGPNSGHYLDHRPEHLRLEPVVVDGATVGWIGFLPVRRDLPAEVSRFLRAQVRAHALALIVALGLVALLAYALARHLSRPVARLDLIVRNLSRGEFDQRARVDSRDEIGRLGENVNLLAETLEKNRSARHRWMTDIAHELRTPVAILKGEMEALRDGLRPADERTFRSLSEEIDHLSVLVDDLQSLALADAGALSLNRQRLELGELVQQAYDAFRDRMAQRGIRLELIAPEPVTVDADSARLRQLLHNLLENCARYVENGGHVRITLSGNGQGAELRIEDSGPGVEPEALAHLFERFYRVERARSRAGGGSGLGLSICRGIAEAHGGSIAAQPSPLGGLAIDLHLPH